jgi:hypothetical protein
MSLQKGLVAHWTMSEDSLQSATVLADKTPYENKGTIYGATFTTDRKGHANKAMSFDGTDDYVSIADSNSVSFGNGTTDTPFTITWWSKMTVSNGARHITKATEYVINNTNAFRVRLIDASTSGYLQKHFGSPSAYLNQWIMFTVTYDGSSTVSGIKAYWNAVEKTGTDESSGTYVAMENSANNLNLGTDGTGYFSGSMSDVRIYNRALSQEEITKLYESYNPCLKLYGGDKEIKENGFIRVDKNINNSIYFDNPESNLYGKTYFYVMQYQARNNGGVPQSTGDGLPWVSISQLDAIQKSKDAGYHLITN